MKANTIVKSKINPDSNWETVKLTFRAGKLTGKYKNWWNTENSYTGDQKSRHTPCCFGNKPSPHTGQSSNTPDFDYKIIRRHSTCKTKGTEWEEERKSLHRQKR